MELRSAVRNDDIPREPASSTRALSRGLNLIGILARSNGGLPLSALARRAQLSKSSAHRLLLTLVQEGFVVRDGDRPNYRLGLKLLWLASDLVDGLGLDRLVRPVLEELVNATHETVHMAMLDGDVAVYVDKIESPHAIRRMYSRVGKRVPFHCTGLGKAMLAHLPEARARTILSEEGMPRRTAHTIVESGRLFHHLATIRSQGYALDDEEHEEGIRCIASPVFDRERQVLGAISIATLAYRVNRRKLLSFWPPLREAAEKATVIFQHHMV